MSELQLAESSINGYLAQSGGAIDPDTLAPITEQVFDLIEDAYFSSDALHRFTTSDECPDCMKSEGEACPFHAVTEQLEKKLLFYLKMEHFWLKMGEQASADDDQPVDEVVAGT